jgi:hypothetical protein
VVQNVYKRQTTTQVAMRTRSEITRFFDGLELVEPGVVWLPQWRPAPDDPVDLLDRPDMSTGLCGIAYKP